MIENTNGQNLELKSEKEMLMSIAISLKRIADVICSPPPTVVELTSEQREEFEKQWSINKSNIFFNKS